MTATLYRLSDYERKPHKPRIDDSAQCELPTPIIILPVIRIEQPPPKERPFQ